MVVMPETTKKDTQGVTFYKTRFLSGITTVIDDYSTIDMWSWNTGTIHMTFRIVLESIKFDTSEPRYEAIYSSHDPDPVNGDQVDTHLSIMTSHTGTIETGWSRSVALRVEYVIVLLCLLASGIYTT